MAGKRNHRKIVVRLEAGSFRQVAGRFEVWEQRIVRAAVKLVILLREKHAVNLQCRGDFGDRRNMVDMGVGQQDVRTPEIEAAGGADDLRRIGAGIDHIEAAAGFDID